MLTVTQETICDIKGLVYVNVKTKTRVCAGRYHSHDGRDVLLLGSNLGVRLIWSRSLFPWLVHPVSG